jgi:glycosyltransferase involved in cell wall biosynthesis
MAKILMITDVPNWIFDRNAWLLKKYIPYHDFDVCYANPIVKGSRYKRRDWDVLEKMRHYDVIWMFHPGFLTHGLKYREGMPRFEYAATTGQEMEEYVNWHNSRGTQIILDVNHLWDDSQSDSKIGKMVLQGNFLTVNNPQTKKYFEDRGIHTHYTPNGYPEEYFKLEKPFKDREFQVVWVGSSKRKEHKGWHILEEVKKSFEGVPNIKFKDVLADSFGIDDIPYTQQDMNKIYNQSQVYLCISESEGGPNPLLESAACGCVPISTDVGYVSRLIDDGESGFIVERTAEAFTKKINFLRTNPDALHLMSENILKRVPAFGWKPWHENFARLINKALAAGREGAPTHVAIKMMYRPKKKILAIIDKPNWTFDRKVKILKEKITNHNIDIGYIDDWEEKANSGEYDVLWFFHLNVNVDFPKYNHERNREGVKVIATINHLIHQDGIKKMLPKLKSFHALSTNNMQGWHRLRQAGLECSYTPDGTPANIFRYEKPIEKRDFKVLWVGSEQLKEHKGHGLFMEMKERLSKEAIGFIDIVGDSEHNNVSLEEMNRHYNDAVIYCCPSASEGGPAPLLESIQCGCVPVMTNVGYARDFDNVFVVERNVDEFIEKILFLKNNPEILHRMSNDVRREAKAWTWETQYKGYREFLDEAAAKIA